ncbi:unnamed protein product [Tilletia controversa]|uniref:MOSC domain-containing protein n=1 Tax=Tilletia controversa TaxID=13291 RepID=A0A8X7MPG3_9BASI|nr:hypothetical protein CF328_g5100 [Tilletia controversa]KAE8244108.1 hypothetical protein A4X06_0g5970 [Tilletia controversa]CAD6901179.1 unnamed protein product [Tilletia controversa]CAD6926400.1 unnamed protein product [Tilletia controversa]CAD6928661.1 unnamed protein product [Tilletia controversa]
MSASATPAPTFDHTQSTKKDVVIESLHVHPIKSCKGVSVQEWEYTETGLKYDRAFLVIDDQNRFCTARELPAMVTITPKVDLANNRLDIAIPLEHKGRGLVTVSTELDPTPEVLAGKELVKDVKLWGHQVDGYIVSPEANEALSLFFDKPVRLIRKGPSLRPSGPDQPVGPREGSWATNYQDFYQVLLASQASLQEVRANLFASLYPSIQPREPLGPAQQEIQQQPSAFPIPDSVEREYWTPEQAEHLEMERFRPNICVASAPGAADNGRALVPFEEDGWTALEIIDSASGSGGNVPFGPEAENKGRGLYCVARCARCQVPSIDIETGKRDPHLPYKLLQRWRIVDEGSKRLGKPCFGMLSAFREKGGTLKVGDIVRVTQTTDPATRKMGK